MLPRGSDEQQLLLATLPPSKGQIRLAIGVVTVLFLAFVLTVPFTNMQLPHVDASFRPSRRPLSSTTSSPQRCCLRNSPSCGRAPF